MRYRLLSSVFYENKLEYSEMYLDRFNGECVYRYNFDIKDNTAFVVINNDIFNKVDKIRTLDKELTLKTMELPLIALKQYTEKCLVDEIKMTNDIEGVVSTRKEINEILHDDKENLKRNRFYGLVKKYQMLVEKDIVLQKCSDIRDVYDEMVLEEVVEEVEDNAPDGEIFRKDKVYIKNRQGNIIHEGILPEERIIELMSESLKILNDEKQNKLVSIAVFHYMFGYVHPFYDGNGRISRFISSYLLSRELQPLVSYRISYTIKRNIDLYYKSFKIANDDKNKGELTHFVNYFFDIIIESLEELYSSLDERNNKLNYYGECIGAIVKFDEKDKTLLYILVQNVLFGDSGIDVKLLSSILELSDSKVRKILNKLNESEVITIQKLGRKNIYDADLEKLEALADEFGVFSEIN